jgi:hypothetical protein
MKAKSRHRPFKAPYSPPEWEAMKAARRNIGHNDAVQESFFLQRQYRRLWSSRVAASPVDLNEVLRTLTQKKIPFVLTGAHAIGGWTGRPRDTHDVDILVKGGRNQARAVNALKALYPQLEVRTVAGITAFFVPGEKQSVIDVTYPHRADLAETRKTRACVSDTGSLPLKRRWPTNMGRWSRQGEISKRERWTGLTSDGW